MRYLLKGFVCSADFSTLSRKAVLIENERIAAIENDIIGSCAADRFFEFKDEIIAPGFIDAHGHSDISALAAPECFSKISQGITAEVCGNCGLSPFPLTGNNFEHIQNLYSNYGFEINWNDFNSYLEIIRHIKPALRLFPLSGHNTLRAAVNGYDNVPLSEKNLLKMCGLLESQLLNSSPGLSAGLLYVPGIFADTSELYQLMKILAKHDRVYTTHLRSEGDKLLESLEETLSIAAEAKLKKVLISHFKTAGKDNFHKLDAALDMIREFRGRGMDVRFDRYPYIESQTMLSVTLGEKYSSYSDRQLSQLLQSEAEQLRAIEHLHLIRDENYWRTRRLAGTTSPAYLPYQGKFLADISPDPAKAVVQILKDAANDSTVAAASMSEENMIKIISAPEAMFGSDGNALPQDPRFGRPHPRSFGSAAKFARILLDGGMEITQLCRKLSGNAAGFFDLPDCGSLKVGNYADITVFSPEEIDSRADFATPCRPAEGIRMVFTGGIPHHF